MNYRMKPIGRQIASAIVLTVLALIPICASADTPPSEATAFAAAMAAATPSAYLKFHEEYPASTHLKISKGTVRARYWFDLMDQTKSGVILTVLGQESLLNTTLDEAQRLGAIVCHPANATNPISAQGRTFNYSAVEIVSGSGFSNGEEIVPTDHVDAVVIYGAADGKMLAVDFTGSKLAENADNQPTYRPLSTDKENQRPPGIIQEGRSGQGWTVSKEFTPKSQNVTIHWAFDNGPTPRWQISFP